MIIRMTGRNTVVNDDFKELTEKKLSKLDRFFDKEVVANVTVINQSSRETVEVTIESAGLFFRSEKTTQDRRDSLDAVVDTLFRQIVKNRSKLRSRMRGTAFEPEVETEFAVPEDGYEIVRNKRFEVKPMDIDEAILQMNLLGHNFYMFRNSETSEINVVYKRNDENYGIIEPQ